MALGLQNVDFIPSLINTFIVRPNPVLTEGQFMDNNIKATLDAFDLNNINIVDYKIKLDASNDIEAWGTKRHFENIPVWAREYLIDGYQQLQGIRPYYQFHSVDEAFAESFSAYTSSAYRKGALPRAVEQYMKKWFGGPG